MSQSNNKANDKSTAHKSPIKRKRSPSTAATEQEQSSNPRKKQKISPSPSFALSSSIAPNLDPQAIDFAKKPATVPLTKHIPTTPIPSTPKITLQSQISTITNQKKLLEDPSNPITSSFPGMWKSRSPPKELSGPIHVKSESQTPSIKPSKNHSKQESRSSRPTVKRKASSSTQLASPDAKRAKTSAAKLDGGKLSVIKLEESVPVTINDWKYEHLSNIALGIQLTENCEAQKNSKYPYKSSVLYRTPLSNVAHRQTQCGMFNEPDINTIMHQMKVLKKKFKSIKERCGSYIAPQPEPRATFSNWDNVLGDVCQISRGIERQKRQNTIRLKQIAVEIKRQWDEKWTPHYTQKYRLQTAAIRALTDSRFEVAAHSRSKSVEPQDEKNENAERQKKVFARKCGLELASAVKTYWNDLFQQFDATKQEILQSELASFEVKTFLDGIVNVRLNEQRQSANDASLVKELQSFYEIKDLKANASLKEIKQAVLLQCCGKLMKEREPAKIRIRGTRFKCSLRDYQHTGLEWLVQLYHNKMNGILADEVGLGKTVQIIALCAWLAIDKRVNGPHLILVPNLQTTNWQNQFKAYFPGYKILMYSNGGTIPYKAKGNKWNACICSYDQFIAHSFKFKDIPWRHIILDEVDQIQDFSAPKWSALFSLSCQYRLLLMDHDVTASANANKSFSVLFALTPNAFDSVQEFESWFDATPLSQQYATHNSNNHNSNIESPSKSSLSKPANSAARKLQFVLKLFTLKRNNSDVSSLPQRGDDIKVLCHLTKRQQDLYDRCLTTVQEECRCDDYQSNIKCIYMLQQICNHPNLFERCQDLNQLTKYDPISQIDYVYQMKSSLKNVQILRPITSTKGDIDKAEKKRTETLYNPVFDKLRDNISKIEKEEKSVNDREDMDVEQEESEQTTESCNSTQQRVIGKETEPCSSLRDALSEPMRAILELQPKENEKTLLDVELFCKYLSPFHARSLSQWNCSKLDALEEILEELHKERRHKVLLFVSDTRMMDIIESFIIICQYQYLRLDHRLNQESSSELMRTFNDEKPFLFLISTRNLFISQFDLVKADKVIFYDHEWNSIVNKNVQKCMKKLCGSHQVDIYRLVNRNTIEENIFNHNVRKTAVSNILTTIHPQQILFGKTHANIHASVSIFNDIVKLIEKSMNRKSIAAFYTQLQRHHVESMTADHDAQIIEFAISNKKIKDKLPAKLLSLIGFQPFANDTNSIDVYYQILRLHLSHLSADCVAFLREFNYDDEVQIVGDWTQRNGTLYDLKSFHKQREVKFLDFNTASVAVLDGNDDDRKEVEEKKESSKKSPKDIEIIKVSSKPDTNAKAKAEKMEMDEDEEDEDDDLQILNTPTKPNKAKSTIKSENKSTMKSVKQAKKASKSCADYKVSKERRDKLVVCEATGDFFPIIVIAIQHSNRSCVKIEEFDFSLFMETLEIVQCAVSLRPISDNLHLIVVVEFT